MNWRPAPSGARSAGRADHDIEEPSQYFSEQPSGTEVRRTITARSGDESWLITASGVFAADGLDRGTAVLLRASPIPVGSPRILDLGCGYGPIALALAVHCPARSWTRWT